jgi:hypothetical protein
MMERSMLRGTDVMDMSRAMARGNRHQHMIVFILRLAWLTVNSEHCNGPSPRSYAARDPDAIRENTGLSPRFARFFWK